MPLFLPPGPPPAVPPATVDRVTSDPRGIPGWDKVGQLTEALVELTGLVVSAVQAKNIRALCNALDDYYKRPSVRIIKNWNTDWSPPYFMMDCSDAEQL